MHRSIIARDNLFKVDVMINWVLEEATVISYQMLKGALPGVWEFWDPLYLDSIGKPCHLYCCKESCLPMLTGTLIEYGEKKQQVTETNVTLLVDNNMQKK